MNFYAEQLQGVVDYLKALNALEVHGKVSLQTPAQIVIFEDAEPVPFGRIVDEVGGIWSWVPPTPTPDLPF